MSNHFDSRFHLARYSELAEMSSAVLNDPDMRQAEKVDELSRLLVRMGVHLEKARVADDIEVLNQAALREERSQ